MPPRNRNQQPPMTIDEEPLPVMDTGLTFDQLQAMNGVNMTEEDMAAAGMVPDAVANDLATAEPQVRRAEPNMQPTGAFMDLGFINQINAAATDEEATAAYNSLDPVQKRVYDRSFGINISPEWAANEAAKYYQQQDERTKATEDPLKQAQLEERRAKLQERKSVQTDFKIRRDNTIKNIEEILGDESYASLVGPIDGTVGGVYDAAFNEKAQAKRAKLDRLVNFDVLDMTKYLRPISQDELKYLRTLVPGQTQNWEVYKQYLGEKLEMLKATDKAAFNPATSLPLAADDAPSSAQPAAAAPSAAQGRNTFTTPDGYTYRRMPDGSAELVE
jgi:hypothetical protein